MTSFRHTILGLVKLGILAALLSGCSSTQIKSTWKDPAYTGQAQKVMVIVVAQEPINRRIIEDEFVLQLSARGTEAYASYTLLSDKKQDDEDAIAKAIAQLGADTVLISRMISKRQVQIYYPVTHSFWPHYYGRWPGYYPFGFEGLNTPSHSNYYEYALMETNMYDARNDNLLWAVISETSVESLNQKLIKPYINTILNLMTEQRLVQK